jgi:hypothetical protein
LGTERQHARFQALGVLPEEYSECSLEKRSPVGAFPNMSPTFQGSIQIQLDAQRVQIMFDFSRYQLRLEQFDDMWIYNDEEGKAQSTMVIKPIESNADESGGSSKSLNEKKHA